MSDYALARNNMVECQIHPSGVTSEELMEAFRLLPRELFIPEARHCQAYCDEDVAMEGGQRFLIEPWVHAKMLQEAEIRPGDVALDVGGGSGYSAGILSQLVTTVVALESDTDLLSKAEQHWQGLGFCNIAGFQGNLNRGCPKHGPYDLIFINGAVCSMPKEICEQLTPNGRLLCVIKPPGKVMGQATIIERSASGAFSERHLFDAGIPYMEGFYPEPEFTF